MKLAITFTNLLAAAGAYAYVAGWQYFSLLRFYTNRTAYSVQDVPLNQIYSASLVVFTDNLHEIVWLVLAGVIVGTICIEFAKNKAYALAVGLGVLYAIVSLDYTNLFAAESAGKYVDNMLSSQTSPRAKFMLKSSAKGHYDRTFIALNEQLRLRLLEITDSDVYVLRKQYLFPAGVPDAVASPAQTASPPAKPQMELVTYRVPKVDYSNVIFYKPPGVKHDEFDLALPPNIWRRLVTCRGALFGPPKDKFTYSLDPALRTITITKANVSMSSGELAQAYFNLPVSGARGIAGLVSRPVEAFALFTDARIVRFHGDRCSQNGPMSDSS